MRHGALTPGGLFTTRYSPETCCPSLGSLLRNTGKQPPKSLWMLRLGILRRAQTRAASALMRLVVVLQPHRTCSQHQSPSRGKPVKPFLESLGPLRRGGAGKPRMETFAAVVCASLAVLRQRVQRPPLPLAVQTTPLSPSRGENVETPIIRRPIVAIFCSSFDPVSSSELRVCSA